MFSKLFFTLFLFSLSTQTIYGYIDPGTGSYILQIIIAVAATCLYAIKYFWSSIKLFFKKIFKKKVKKTAAAPPPKVVAPMQAKGKSNNTPSSL